MIWSDDKPIEFEADGYLRPRTPGASHQPHTGECPHCGPIALRDVPIHGGQSLRRDCGRVGRFRDFPCWYGKDALQYETHPVG